MSTKYPWDSEAPRAPPPSAVAKLRRTRARGILAKASDDNIIPLGGRGKHFKGHAKRGKHEIRKAHEQTPKALKRKLPISAQGLPAVFMAWFTRRYSGGLFPVTSGTIQPRRSLREENSTCLSPVPLFVGLEPQSLQRKR